MKNNDIKKLSDTDLENTIEDLEKQLGLCRRELEKRALKELVGSCILKKVRLSKSIRAYLPRKYKGTPIEQLKVYEFTIPDPIGGVYLISYAIKDGDKIYVSSMSRNFASYTKHWYGIESICERYVNSYLVDRGFYK